MKGKKSDKKLFAAAAVALGMTLFAGLRDVSAYFTTYVSAGGSQVVRLGAQTEIHEEVSQMTKHISITNTSETGACFVRVKAFHDSRFTVDYDGAGWTAGEEGYWYYGEALAPGESTGVLDAKIGVPEGFDREEFNVVVIQECAPLVYDADGNPTADWDAVYTDTDYRGEEVRD